MAREGECRVKGKGHKDRVWNDAQYGVQVKEHLRYKTVQSRTAIRSVSGHAPIDACVYMWMLRTSCWRWRCGTVGRARATGCIIN